MTPLVRKALDDLDAILSKQDADSICLWDILTALRGPDDREDVEHEKFATCYIRREAFPKTTRYSHSPILRALFGYPTPTPPTINPEDYHRHYIKHILRAYAALAGTPRPK